ncbi:MAG TPA: hypothetical protein VFX21_06715 [Acidimicrobiia bacterium]|nr:hypothetical protein [Acidimicrobiia bacterium]
MVQQRERAYPKWTLGIGTGVESSTMALYVTIVLLATTSLLTDADMHDIGILAVVWGESFGLAIAHFFAFVLAVHLVHGEAAPHEWRTAREQLAGALSVATICTIPVFLVPESAELDVVRVMLAVVLALSGYAAARANGGSQRRAVIVGAVVLVGGLTIAVMKNVIGGH